MTTQQMTEMLEQDSLLKGLVKILINSIKENDGCLGNYDDLMWKLQAEEFEQLSTPYESDCDYEDYDSMHYANYGE